MKNTIRKTFLEVLASQDKKLVGELNDESILLNTGLDSLGFARLVIQLEEELGFDPFALSETPFYPRTFGEFVRFYEANAPK